GRLDPGLSESGPCPGPVEAVRSKLCPQILKDRKTPTDHANVHVASAEGAITHAEDESGRWEEKSLLPSLGIKHAKEEVTGVRS
ncbi:MAG: hypothetical protein P8Y94_17950, partial [Acidobacteriota bacterium]